MNYEYIIALFVLCSMLVGGVCLTKYMRNFKLGNLIFILLVYVPYVCLCAYVFHTDDDPNRWNFRNTLPVANVSPFMFSIMPLLFVLPKKAKEAVYRLIALLSVGMFFSTVLGCVGNAMRDYAFHFHFMLDYVSHFALCLFGIYLVRSKQVSVNLRSCAISASILYGVALAMLVLNLLLDTSFFGLSLRGKHNIYNNVLVESSYLSALIYFVGLFVVLSLGFALCRAFAESRYSISPKAAS